MLGTLGVVLSSALLGACNSDDSTGTFSLTTGGETDALTRTPAPSTLVVEQLATDGSTKELARTALPADTVSLGDVGTGDVGAIVVRALDPAGTELLHGETLFFQFGALADTTVSVFIQRRGEFARMPSGLGTVLDAPVAQIVLDRYLVAASGTSTVLYDLLQMRVSSAPALGRPAKSLATYTSSLIVIDDAGASALDLSAGTTTELSTPSGGTFADVAGGQTVTAPDGAVYVVGGTRTSGGPSTRVLHITSDGNATFTNLAVAREGACATWVEGRGLVVAGGSATGAGIEVLSATTATATSLPYPPDATRGCAAATLDTSHVLIAGGSGGATDLGGGAPVRSVDLSCAANCAPTAGTTPVPLVRAQAVTLGTDAALITGDDATGATRAFRTSVAEVREVPLRAPRKGGRSIAMPTGGALVIGGAVEVEQYRD